MTETSYPTRDLRLLLRLSADDLALLASHLKRVALPLHKKLEGPHKLIEQIYFIESGFASVVTASTAKSTIEVGMVGCEGMTGLSVVFGADRGPHETCMQSAGGASRIAPSRLRQAMARSRTLHNYLLLYAHAFVVQATHAVVANGRSKLEERLARWLLMAQDRLGADDLIITHEALSGMLGVGRPGVTVALRFLEGAGLIQIGRGIIAWHRKCARASERRRRPGGCPPARSRR